VPSPGCSARAGREGPNRSCSRSRPPSRCRPCTRARLGSLYLLMPNIASPRNGGLPVMARLLLPVVDRGPAHRARHNSSTMWIAKGWRPPRSRSRDFASVGQIAFLGPFSSTSCFRLGGHGAPQPSSPEPLPERLGIAFAAEILLGRACFPLVPAGPAGRFGAAPPTCSSSAALLAVPRRDLQPHETSSFFAMTFRGRMPWRATRKATRRRSSSGGFRSGLIAATIFLFWLGGPSHADFSLRGGAKRGTF